MSSTCNHSNASSHIVDSRFHSGGFSTEESKAIFCDHCRLQRWLDIEAALAQAQAANGMIPQEAADEIVRNCRLELLDLEKIQKRIAETSHSLLPLLDEVVGKCDKDAGQYIHFGATTQDIQDTGTILELRQVTEIVERDLDILTGTLRALCRDHEKTVMMGRTHAMPAIPMTFGLKAAIWLDEVNRHQERVKSMRERLLVGELGGAIGTMVALEPNGEDVLKSFCEILGLGEPRVCWHASRDRITEFVNTLALITTSLARIMDEIRTLSRPEIGELAEPWVPGTVGSTTMPHKRNPENCEQVVALARLCASLSGASYGFMLQDNERDYRGTRMEWPVTMDISHYTLTALKLSIFVLAGLEVNENRMMKNLNYHAEDLASEALMFALAPHFGKHQAHEMVYDLVNEATEKNTTLREAIQENAAVSPLLSDEELERIFTVKRHVGLSANMIKRVTG